MAEGSTTTPSSDSTAADDSVSTTSTTAAAISGISNTTVTTTATTEDTAASTAASVPPATSTAEAPTSATTSRETLSTKLEETLSTAVDPNIPPSESGASANGNVAAHDEDSYYPEEEVTEGDWQRPDVSVSLVNSTHTGEEDEEVFWTHRSKLYRYDSGSGVWKERGLGYSKLLKHKETGKIRFLLRQEKTLKIVANHYVIESGVYCKLTPNVGNDKIWVWTVVDGSDDPPKQEQFGLKFAAIEQATIFKEKFEEAAKHNASLEK